MLNGLQKEIENQFKIRHLTLPEVLFGLSAAHRQLDLI